MRLIRRTILRAMPFVASAPFLVMPPRAGSEPPKELTNDTPSSHVFFYTDVSAESTLELCNAIRDTHTTTHVHIQSHGGSAMAAFHVCDFFHVYPTVIHTHVEGIAASAASLMSVSGDVRTMSPHSFLLLHQPSMTPSSQEKMTYSDLQDESYNMHLVLEQMIDVYVSHSRLNRTSARELIMTERYLTSNECLQLGLVDAVL